MSWWDTPWKWARDSWDSIFGFIGDPAQAARNTFRQLSTFAQAIDYTLSHPFTQVMNEISYWSAFVTGNQNAANAAYARLEGHVAATMISPLRGWVAKQLAALRIRITYVVGMLRAELVAEIRKTHRWVERLMRSEAFHRRQGDRRERALMLARVKWAMQTINRSAASGYAMGSKDRGDLIRSLAGDIVTANPVERELIDRIVSGALDVAELDDPLARLALSTLLPRITRDLGIDAVAGAALRDLLLPVLDHGIPRNLHDAIAALAERTTALEQQWATFYKDGGSDILQAGQDWKGITAITTDAVFLAFFGQQIADPAGWAREITDTVGVVITDAISEIAKVLGKVG